MGIRKLIYAICAVAVSLGITQYAAASLAAKRMTRPPAPVAKRAAVPKPQQMGLPNPAQKNNITDFRNEGLQEPAVSFEAPVTYQGSEFQETQIIMDHPSSKYRFPEQAYSNLPNQGYPQDQWRYEGPVSNNGYYYVQPQTPNGQGPWSSMQDSEGNANQGLYER
jgi:hypothetical protein